ncbi:MAG: tRNA (adenosine(37)-N6)-threonylcarbamoyltransferase complex dimerization subunit type 1 TsaB [Candidatus Cryosericum sp.]|nr:tRNA (adenosine(37)-N6)-threonylcarbamoyltransferase complex dimerization subunit type 1 TsaB [Candidatus Cryosericum sp.]HPS70076.1 tRNA (adenosine(37)-N6)-threonylcarbamoyltransferase complex dimerization subunit type 1 TsaB [Candidatus Cryosericum sp.]
MSEPLSLLINTATVSGVVGLARGTSPVASELLQLATASNAVVPSIQRMLERQGCTVPDIERIVVVKGPGTFTGSRIGTSIAKALAYVAGCPLVSVTTLECVGWTGMARLGRQDGALPVWTLLDARRHEFYVQQFMWRSGTLMPTDEPRCTGREVLEAVQDSGGVALCAFASSLAPGVGAAGAAEWQFDVYPTCEGIIAASGTGHLEDPLTLEPLYLRSMEELFDKPRNRA